MNGNGALFSLLVSVCAPLSFVLGAETVEPSSLTALGKHETPYRHMTPALSWTLGPTGARGWVRGHRGGKLFWGENGREILVTWVYSGSPADGKLQQHDVITGVNGKTFDRDARVCLGEAIAVAERTDGKLNVLRWRQGEVRDVTIAISTLGPNATVIPLTPEGTKAIREQVLDFLVETMSPNGFEMDPVWQSPNTLFLLAHGRPEHLDHVRRNVRRVIDTMPNSEYGPWNWQKGADAILLSEYFLATGDTSVLPALDQIGKWLRESQSYMGGFGHGGPYGGYGHVGLPGMFSTIGLALMKECGVTGFDDVLEPALQFYARGAGLGMMGYGGFDATTNLKTNYGDNGKCGTAAVLYDVIGYRAMSKSFAQMACALAPYAESGHTGNYWSFSWGTLGAGIANDGYVKRYYDELGWWYALARTYRGGLAAQPWPHTVEGYRGMSIYVYRGEETSSGGLALGYCRPLHSLRILGAEKSVFCQDLEGTLAQARQLIYDKDYQGCLGLLDGFDSPDKETTRWAALLRQKAQQALTSIDLTTQAIAADLRKGDHYVAERRLNALDMIQPEGEDVAAFTTVLATPESVTAIAAGKDYHELMRRVKSGSWEQYHRAPGIVLDPDKRKSMETLAKRRDAGCYAAMAKEALARWPAEFTSETPLFEKSFLVESRQKLYLDQSKDAGEGVNYAYFEFKTVPEGLDSIRQMEPIKKGTTKGFDLEPRSRDVDFAFAFNTFIDAPDAGDYAFTLASDDGGWLLVDGDLLIDNGGLHGMTPSKTATVALSKGRHAVEVVMFQGRYGYGLKVGVAPVDEEAVGERVDADFEVPDVAACQKLRLRVKTLLPVSVRLNGEVIYRMPKKRAKTTDLMDPGWVLWEEVTLQPAALELLRKGSNTLSVGSSGGYLGAPPGEIEVELHGIRSVPSAL